MWVSFVSAVVVLQVGFGIRSWSFNRMCVVQGRNSSYNGPNVSRSDASYGTLPTTQSRAP